MINASTAALAISIARGVVKLGGRIDRLMAEEAATTGDIVLPMPPVVGGMTVIAKARELSEYLEKTKDGSEPPVSTRNHNYTNCTNTNIENTRE